MKNYISLQDFLNKQDEKWKDDTRSLERAILMFDGMESHKEYDIEEIIAVRNGLLQCMFVDLPSNVFEDALSLYNAEQDRRED